MDKIRAIELKYIQNIIPNKLLSCLNRWGANTVEDVMSIDNEEFSNSGFVGIKTIEQLLKLKELLCNEQENVYSIYRINSGIIDKSVYDRLKDIKLNQIIHLIPLKLYKKFVANNMTDVKSVLDTSIMHFLEKPSIGSIIGDQYNEFREKLISDPDTVIDASQKSFDIKLPLNFNSNEMTEEICFLELFVTIVNDYFSIVNNERDQQIVLKRFGINSKEKYTLEDLSSVYEITREYARKIINKHLIKLKDLIEGNKIVKPNLELSKSAHKTMKTFLDNVFNKKIITKRDIEKILLTNYKRELNTDVWNILIFIFSVMGIEVEKIRKNDFFIIDKDIDHIILRDVANTTYSILNDTIRPIGFFDMVVRAKKRLGRKDVDRVFFDYTLDIIYQIEKIPMEFEIFIQLKFEYLASLKDMAYRILFEKKTRLDSKEITRIILHKLSKANYPQDISERSVGCQLSSDNRFSSIGKSGWALKEWNLNDDTIITLIKKALHSLNKPSSLVEICNEIEILRSGVNKRSILSYLNSMKYQFIKIEGNLYILNEWKKSYKNFIGRSNTSRRPKILDIEFSKILINIFIENDLNEMTLNDIFNAALEKIDIGSRALASKIGKSKILIKEKSGQKNLFKLKTNYEEILKIRHLNKIDQIISKTIAIISRTENNVISQTSLVKQLEREYGFLKTTIYHVLNKNSLFKKIKENNGNTCITLRDENFKEPIDKSSR